MRQAINSPEHIIKIIAHKWSEHFYYVQVVRSPELDRVEFEYLNKMNTLKKSKDYCKNICKNFKPYTIQVVTGNENMVPQKNLLIELRFSVLKCLQNNAQLKYGKSWI